MRSPSSACSDEAVQGSAKAGTNRMELVELKNVIGDQLQRLAVPTDTAGG